MIGRKSEPEAVIALPVGLEAVTPPPQRRKSMAGTHKQPLWFHTADCW